ncbi:hypothetical protein MRI28_11820 [Nocardiopsis dassonvillei]|uniref:hypothetical protein n=1 Tax=Nocardiopsis dassonvillei TaxID=2014 RepID=UPI00200CAA33|nr:hypothetical protein [Nocardiopsis dassonvillei]MCK9870319.1 hypothetical protein [Nocardiopsis dassonvillei]
MSTLHPLPHTGMSVPDTSVRVSCIDDLTLSSGNIAFRAEVQAAGLPLGTFHDDGRGGATVFAPRSPKAALIMQFFVALSRDRNGDPLLEETVYDHLVEEFEIGEMVAQATEEGRYAVRSHTPGHIPQLHSFSLANDHSYPDHEGARTAVTSEPQTFGPDTVRLELWTGTGWTEVLSHEQDTDTH